MVDLFHECMALLRASGYATSRAALGEATMLFEDATIAGFVAVFDRPENLLGSWRAHQERFLRAYASQLKRDPAKAWSLYAIFLTGPQATAEQTSELLMLEEDMTACRKIARSGIPSTAELRQALGPVLPLLAVSTDAEESVEGALARKLDERELRLFGALTRSWEEQSVLALLTEMKP